MDKKFTDPTDELLMLVIDASTGASTEFPEEGVRILGKGANKAVIERVDSIEEIENQRKHIYALYYKSHEYVKHAKDRSFETSRRQHINEQINELTMNFYSHKIMDIFFPGMFGNIIDIGVREDNFLVWDKREKVNKDTKTSILQKIKKLPFLKKYFHIDQTTLKNNMISDFVEIQDRLYKYNIALYFDKVNWKNNFIKDAQRGGKYTYVDDISLQAVVKKPGEFYATHIVTEDLIENIVSFGKKELNLDDTKLEVVRTCAENIVFYNFLYNIENKSIKSSLGKRYDEFVKKLEGQN
jgi:hypothetical protein